MKTLQANLQKHGIGFQYFDTEEQAIAYLTANIQGETVAFGGSMTVKELGLYEALEKQNKVFWHWVTKTEDQRSIEAQTTVYITSANAIAETGELVNIDGTGNRVANSFYGPKKVYYICGENKVTPDLHSAINRARTVAAPLNAKRLNLATPCAADGKCHDCSSPSRICNVMSIVMGKTSKQEQCEVLIIGKKLGY